MRVGESCRGGGTGLYRSVAGTGAGLTAPDRAARQGCALFCSSATRLGDMRFYELHFNAPMRLFFQDVGSRRGADRGVDSTSEGRGGYSLPGPGP